MIKVFLVSPEVHQRDIRGLLTKISGGVIVTQDFLDTLDLSGPSHTSLLGTVTALYDVGCFFGAVAAFSIGERLGRKKSILVGTTVRIHGKRLPRGVQ